MNELRDDSVVLDVQENDQTLIDGSDIRHEDRQAWVAGLKKRVFSDKTISSVGRAATAANKNDSNNSSPSIYRIPACIRDVNPDAYEPRVISLGPYNCHKPGLQAMNELKRCYFRRFRSRNPKTHLDDYLALVEELESQVRGAYKGLEPSFHGKEFIEMMLLDCCFVLEFLLLNEVYFEEEEQGGDEEEEELINPNQNLTWAMPEEEEELIDPNQKFAWAMPFLMRDMLLLENQLPFFLLENLFELNRPYQTTPLSKIICDKFWDLMPGKICRRPINMRSDVNVPIRHILHLMQSCATPTPLMDGNLILSCLYKMFLLWARIFKRDVQDNQHDRVDPEVPTLMWFPSAMTLREIGMLFIRKRNYRSFLDITFARGVIEIPPFQIYNNTDSILHNLIAFEQCHGTCSYFSSYVCLMNFMVNTVDDVALLKREGILTSTLDSDDDIVNLFHKLYMNSAIDNRNYLTSIFDNIPIYYLRMNRWKAAWNQDWGIITVVAAIVLFALSIIQTLLAFFSYLRPISSN